MFLGANASSTDGLAKQILYTSDLVTPGSPSIYKPHIRDEMRRKSTMTVRKSIGDPRNNGHGANEKVFLLVGATGAGKSTLINGMVNYILDVKWEDDFRFQLITENEKQSQVNSQTQEITAYTFHPMKGSAISYTFTVIDTPGFGATEGLEKDREITAQIKEFFSIPPPEGIDHLDGIGFVAQAHQVRLTSTQKYIFASILSIFGKDVSKNIILMLTFADGKKPLVLQAIQEAEVPHQMFFKFNNSALFEKKSNATLTADGNSDSESDDSNFDEVYWKMGMVSFKKFFDKLPKFESASLRLTQEVLREREQLHVSLQGLNKQIKLGLSQMEEMRQEEIALKEHEDQIKANKDFTYEVDVVKQEKVDLSGKSQYTTTCVECNNTCHEDCRIADDAYKYKCWAMDDQESESSHCRICSRKCKWQDHHNLPYIIKLTWVKERRTYKNLKDKYHDAVEGKATVEKMMSSLEDDLQKVHNQVYTMIKQAQKSVRRLDEIALKPNPLTEVEYIEILIKSEEQERKPGYIQRIEYYKEAKTWAELLSKVKDEAESKRLIEQFSKQHLDVRSSENKALVVWNSEKKALEGRHGNWYARFQFW